MRLESKVMLVVHILTQCEADDFSKVVGVVLELFPLEVLAGVHGLEPLRAHGGLVFVGRHVAG
jgi:hypothetical protein